jgi:hypothetical protein
MGVGTTPWSPELLESFTGEWFRLLEDDPDREIVFGHAGGGLKPKKVSAEEFKTFQEAPLLKIAMNFRIEDLDATHCTLTTETRVYAVGRDVQRGFAAYWRMIYPGSSLTRHEWLRAIKLRAEGATDVNSPSASSSARRSSRVSSAASPERASLTCRVRRHRW